MLSIFNRIYYKLIPISTTFFHSDLTGVDYLNMTSAFKPLLNFLIDLSKFDKLNLYPKGASTDQLLHNPTQISPKDIIRWFETHSQTYFMIDYISTLINSNI